MQESVAAALEREIKEANWSKEGENKQQTAVIVSWKSRKVE